MSILSARLIQEIVQSEQDYMLDRMTAIREKNGNPEGVELARFGRSLCLYSRTMPWGTFNTIKGFTSEDIGHLEDIVRFYRSLDRKAQFEIVPGTVDQETLKQLSERGFYQSGFHASLYIEPTVNFDDDESITIRELQEDQFEAYATVHCRGFGLPDDGIPHVAGNNKILFNRPGWKFFVAYKDDVPAAVSVMFMKDDIASLTFAATLPEYRNQGFHRSLLKKRIETARQHNCRLIVGQCSFLSQSHRNMESAGLKIGYVRATWMER